VTTGLTDVLPEIPGLRERWGRTVLHCPYCHGYEVRGRSIGLVASSPWAMHGALLWGQWTDDLVLFLNDAFTPDQEQTRQLAARKVTVVPGAVREITDEGVRLMDGAVVPREYLVAQSRLEARADLLGGIGLTAVEHPMGVGTQVPVEDPSGRTSVPGVWVAGNVADPMAQVVTSAAAGLAAGAMINMDLVTADVETAVAGSRQAAAPW
jgi:thioredoxin reductase